jgi:formylglycine-generating enzyme required for sulfatase activity
MKPSRSVFSASRFSGGFLIAASLAITAACLNASPARAVTIDFVTVGDPGNVADTNGYGSVADSFQISKYEITNALYTDFLNSVDPTGANPYYIYTNVWGANDYGSIHFYQGNANGSKYQLYNNKGDKPVNAVSWFDAARVANWLHNGGGSGDTENGAYTLNGAYTGNAVARNPGAQCYIPTESQWYKAAYYKGGGQNAGYWSYSTQSNSVPSPVTATSVGVGQVGATSPVTSGNYANYDDAAVWNSAGGDETTVGSNGGPSAYGAFDMTGNVSEWNDFDGLTGDYYRGLRGGSSRNGSSIQASSFRERYASSGESLNLGFRLAAPVAPVPEPSTYAMAFAGLACGGFSVWRRRRRA